jgi:hypothetical protein
MMQIPHDGNDSLIAIIVVIHRRKPDYLIGGNWFSREVPVTLVSGKGALVIVSACRNEVITHHNV